MNCWTILGLRADADERAIKRSYAALLKVHRPDEDLDAFQRLRGAYEQALSIARRRAEDDERMFVSADADGPGDTALLAELERSSVQTDTAAAGQAQMLASLSDLTSVTLSTLGALAKAEGQLALFECCLLQRCLEDSEQGYAAAQWALARLAWLTPWQEASLPAMQMDMLASRLLATELHSLHALLAEGDEKAFLARVAVLHEQDWLQSFDRRALFDQHLADLLLDTPSWTQKFFDELCASIGWDGDNAHLPCDASAWRELQRRCESPRLQASLGSHMGMLWPASPEQGATWMLLKSLRNGERRRLADGFREQDWHACQYLEATLKYQHPELIGVFNDNGVYDWRRWVPGHAWFTAYPCLMVLFILLYVASGWWAGHMAKDPEVSLMIHVVVGGMFAFVALLVCAKFHAGWSGVCKRLAGVDVWISEFLLPRIWVREGTGLLLLRHFVPAVCVGLIAWVFGLRFGAGAPAVGGLSTALALLFANYVCRGWAPETVLIILNTWLSKPWWTKTVLVIVVVVMVVVLGHISMNSAARPSTSVVAPEEFGISSAVEALVPEDLARCTWTRQYNGLCTMPGQKQD